MNIPYGRQSVGIGEAIAAFRATLSPAITQGPRVSELEEKICDFTGAQFAVAVSSGTAGLHLAALAANCQKAKKVLVPSLTFAATASSVVLAGGQPQIVDISPDTWNMDFQLIPHKNSLAITVDFAGLPSGITEIADKASGMRVVQDCAHSLGAHTPSGPVGSQSSALMSCFSLHPVKSITAGEGGIVTTNDPEMAERLREVRTHGINRSSSRRGWEYDIHEIGLNYRITDIQAAIAIRQLKRLSGFIEARNEIAERYRQLLGDIPVELPPAAPSGFRHAYHLFPILLQDESQRDFLYDHFHRSGILVQVHYKPLHQLSAFAKFAPMVDSLPVATSVGARILSLPIFPGLRPAQQKKVVRVLKEGLRLSNR